MGFRLDGKEKGPQAAEVGKGPSPGGSGFVSACLRFFSALILVVLTGYKRYISPFLPHACRFEPTCSVYMYQAIQKRGLIKGMYLGIRRLSKCHPFCSGGYDPVP